MMVEAPDYDFIHAYANTEPGGGSTVIDAWNPVMQTVLSLAAYTNDSLDREKYNARWWRDAKDNMLLYQKALK